MNFSPSIKSRQKRAIEIINILEVVVKKYRKPLIPEIIEIYGRDPFLILISCLLSLRAKDIVTYDVCRKLFSVAKTPQEIISLDLKSLEKILYSVTFYIKKSKILKEVSQTIIKRFNGKVPSTEKELLSIKGIGRKTAALVLSKAFLIPAICVDTHVHRISNRLGLVKTKTTFETEMELKKILPKKYWSRINELFVTWGQNVCVPISPFCSTCAIKDLCPRIGVTKSR